MIIPDNRPHHKTGESNDTLGKRGGGLATRGAFDEIRKRSPSTWPGGRDQMFLPYLFIRTQQGDLGARPTTGAFWESPDIYILPGVAPDNAPDTPPQNLSGMAKAKRDNTIYAHVWNLGQAAAYGSLVEFYWFNPSIGFNDAGANLVGRTYIDLNGRGNVGSHKLVKCPVSWKAQFLNGGHECLVVRITHSSMDPLSSPAWDAAQNRHIGQRNIHVMSAPEAQIKPTLGIEVGPVFGQNATVKVERAQTNTMPWLHLLTGSRTDVPTTAKATGDIGISAPVDVGNKLPDLGGQNDPKGSGAIDDGQTVKGDNMKVGFLSTDGDPGQGNAHVYRVTAEQGGQTFGGYTIVVTG